MKHRLIVQDIFIYPIKSLGGIRLSEAEVQERGFQYDRRWMLVDSSGMFLTQRNLTQLALLEVKTVGDQLHVFSKKSPEIQVQVPIGQAEGPEITVTIWDDELLAKIVSNEIDQWFSKYLGFEAHLVVMPESTHRKVDPRYAVLDESVSFADGMPYLLIGQESLDDLNSKLASSVPMDRFRPNIVMTGGSAFFEDQLIKIKIGEVDFQIVKPCARCVLTTVDQASGEKGKEPLRTLSTYRTRNNKIYFGQNVVALQSGTVRVGDEIAY